MKRIAILPKVGHILSLKCPNCGKSKVFYKNENSFISFPKMKEDCESCHYHFDREPGYFLGAMYVSYGLAVFEGIFTFLSAKFLIPNMSTFGMALLTVIVIMLCAIWNYKLARIIWMNIFPN